MPAHDPADTVTALPDGDLREAVLALTTRVEQAHATYTGAQALLTEHYRETSNLLAGVLRRLGHPNGPYDDQIDDTDRRLIALLDAGTKRQSLHTEAGIRVYEVSTRLKRLYDLTGSQTQFQFGRACTLRLWLPGDSGLLRGGPN